MELCKNIFTKSDIYDLSNYWYIKDSQLIKGNNTMDYEEIYEYLKGHSPKGLEFSFPDDRDYWNVDYKGNTGWVYIPQHITIEELDNAVIGSIEFIRYKDITCCSLTD